mmetsp:Transcript_1577/g.3539  ORF Transcript_1577/g.3539 Transcript_1577/m.3539 type:complete len:286 (+) Transcript_1577:419-1276(+)
MGRKQLFLHVHQLAHNIMEAHLAREIGSALHGGWRLALVAAGARERGRRRCRELLVVLMLVLLLLLLAQVRWFVPLATGRGRLTRAPRRGSARWLLLLLLQCRDARLARTLWLAASSAHRPRRRLDRHRGLGRGVPGVCKLAASRSASPCRRRVFGGHRACAPTGRRQLVQIHVVLLVQPTVVLLCREVFLRQRVQRRICVPDATHRGDLQLRGAHNLLLDAVSIAQRVDGVIRGRGDRADAADHDRSGVDRERVLEHHCQLGGTVRHVGRTTVESADTLLERQQ